MEFVPPAPRRTASRRRACPRRRLQHILQRQIEQEKQTLKRTSQAPSHAWNFGPVPARCTRRGQIPIPTPSSSTPPIPIYKHLQGPPPKAPHRKGLHTCCDPVSPEFCRQLHLNSMPADLMLRKPRLESLKYSNLGLGRFNPASVDSALFLTDALSAKLLNSSNDWDAKGCDMKGSCSKNCEKML